MVSFGETNAEILAVHFEEGLVTDLTTGVIAILALCRQIKNVFINEDRMLRLLEED